MKRSPQHVAPPPEIFAPPPGAPCGVAGLVSCFAASTLCNNSTVGVQSPHSMHSTCAPFSATLPGIYETLTQLQSSLGPLVESLRKDPEARSLLTVLQEENLQLRARILRLEALIFEAEGVPLKELAQRQLHEASAAKDSGQNLVDSVQSNATLTELDREVVDVYAGAVVTVPQQPTARLPPLLYPHAPMVAKATSNPRCAELDPDQSLISGKDNPGGSASADRGRGSRATRGSRGSHDSNHTESGVVMAHRETQNEPVFIDPPARAFVINVRRLIDAQETLSLLHNLIESTAIAALTLVSAASVEQLTSTIMFLFVVILTFVVHGRKWDLLEVSDLRMLLPLLADDDEGNVTNPNRLLKALSFSRSPFGRICRCFFVLCCIAIFTISWLVCEEWWIYGPDEAGVRDTNTEIRWILDSVIRNEEDAAVVCIQVTVGSLMFILHVTFEIFYWNETCAVMPRTASGDVWDVRTHGLPWRYKLFGAPSMWFTSTEALEDLMKYIDMAVPTAPVWEIRPQEIAYYALQGDEERITVQRTLKASKLFDGRTREFVDGSLPGTPLQLSIELCFFDQALQNKNCEHRGEYLCLVDEEECGSCDIKKRTQLAPRTTQTRRWMGWARAPKLWTARMSSDGDVK